MTTATEATDARDPQPYTVGKPSRATLATLWAFVTIPFVALLAALPLAIMGGWGPSWLDVGLFVATYFIATAGVGVGFHRYFTHGSFKANRGLRIGLAIAGSVGVEGDIIQWVADHRRHHQFSDKEGDPHSPWRYGTSKWGLTKGLFHAHIGWLFTRELSNRERFAPDLLRDKDIQRIDKLFPLFVFLSLAGPAILAGLVTWSWAAALTAFFWAGLIRVALLHHVTWSINSVCHVFGERPYEVRNNQDDKAANFWPLAILSFGESWHNLHHADPTLARHGAGRGEIDINARLIWLFEKFGWATKVKWPTPERLAKISATA